MTNDETMSKLQCRKERSSIRRHSSLLRHSSFVIAPKKPRPEGLRPAKYTRRHGIRPVAFPVMKRIWKRKWFWPLVVILVAVVIVRLMLAIWVRDYVNRKLNEMDEYRGHIAAVDIHLWRGAYTIHRKNHREGAGPI